MPTFTITYWTGTQKTVEAATAWDAALAAGYEADYLKRYATGDETYSAPEDDFSVHAIIWSEYGDLCAEVALTTYEDDEAEKFAAMGY